MNRKLVMPLAALVLVLAGAGPASAGEEGGPDAAAAAKALLDGCKGYDESLAATVWLGVYVQETNSIGKVKLEIGKAPEGEGVYLSRMAGSFNVGPSTGTLLMETRLDETFAVVSRVSTSEDSSRPAAKVSVKARREGDKWICESAVGERKATYTSAYAGKDHYPETALIPLCLRIDPAKTGEYLFRGLRWPTGPGPNKPGDTVALGDEACSEIRIVVPPMGDLLHRGKTVKACVMRVQRGPREVFCFAVGENRRFLGYWPEERNVMFIAGTEEEAGQNIADPGAAEKDAAREAAMKFLKVLFKSQPAETLDEVMDWKAVREDEAASNPAVKDMSDADYAADVKKRVEAKGQAVPPQMLEQLPLTLKVVLAGDTATVSRARRGGEPISLKKIDGKWKIVKLPKI